RNQWLQIGRMHIYTISSFDCNNPYHKWIVNFPTKQDWRQPSQLAWIECGLNDLRFWIEHLGVRSIAVPPLGCGLGGLSWVDVRELIRQSLKDLPSTEVMLYAPQTH
ncbi:MAG: macro domain-containing protein, partial [Gammaproteobacteria bacterium]